MSKQIQEETVANYTASGIARKEAQPNLAPCLTTSNLLVSYCRDLYENETQATHQEILMVVALTATLRPLGHLKVFMGTSNSCTTSPVPVFRFLIERNAIRFALVHNHPSGDPTPSESDIVLTSQMQAAGELMEISMIDHLILGKGVHYNSMNGLGYMDDPFESFDKQ